MPKLVCSREKRKSICGWGMYFFFERDGPKFCLLAFVGVIEYKVALHSMSYFEDLEVSGKQYHYSQ